jgi:hypothetical protein
LHQHNKAWKNARGTIGSGLIFGDPLSLGRIHVTFIDKEGDEHTFEVAKGDNLLDIAQANDLEMEGERPMTKLTRAPD